MSPEIKLPQPETDERIARFGGTILSRLEALENITL